MSDWRKDEGIPRASCLDLNAEAELAIRNVVHLVETIGAHPLLTETVILLGQAKDKLGAYYDTVVLNGEWRKP